MSKEAEQTLVLTAHDMKTMSPQLWAEFVRALDDYALAKCVEAVNAPLDLAHVARGHAQGIMALSLALKDLDARAAAIQKHRKRHSP